MGQGQGKAAAAASPAEERALALPGIDIAASPEFTMADVAKHSTPDDLWLVLHGAWPSFHFKTTRMNDITPAKQLEPLAHSYLVRITWHFRSRL